MTEARTQQAYEALMRRRALEQKAAPVPLDTVRELAESPTVTDQQLELLEQILAHPTTRDEFYFLRELAMAERPPLRSWLPAGAAAAAMLVVTAGVGLMIHGRLRNEAEPMRGGASQLVLAAPAAEQTISTGQRFAWHPMDGASRYTLELLDADGEQVWRSEVNDTTAVLPASVALRANTRYTWVVQASLTDGTTVRSAPRTVSARE